ncbi:MAG: trypsin-like serine protease [Planctomycetota bacterium]|nr:MAG: trypsin-like serine protease [Planctomycetota bacterium]
MTDEFETRPEPARPSCQLHLAGWILVAAALVLGLQAWRTTNFGLFDEKAEPRAIVARGDLAADEQSTIELFAQSSGSVVHVSTEEQVVRRNFFSYDILNVPAGQGSGFLWSADGYVVTNYHLAGKASRRIVRLADGQSYEGYYVGGDDTHDLAVLKINPVGLDLEAIPIGTSSDLLVGQKVFAIGNPFGLDQTLTTGIISGLDRTITSVARTLIHGVIQTDAAINPGNSGGPLLDSAGRLIGINTAIYSPSGASAGIGFAVPVDTINRIVPQIIASGSAERAGLGVVMVPDHLVRRSGIDGVVIGSVRKGSAAERAGLRGLDPARNVMDVILSIDGRAVRLQDDLRRIFAEKQVGEEVVLELEREGRRLRVPVRLQDVR